MKIVFYFRFFPKCFFLWKLDIYLYLVFGLLVFMSCVNYIIEKKTW